MNICWHGNIHARTPFVTSGAPIETPNLAIPIQSARLAQSVEHQTFNLRVMGSSPILGDNDFCIFLTSSLWVIWKYSGPF